MAESVPTPRVPGPARRLAALVALAAPLVVAAASLEVMVRHFSNLAAMVVSIAAVTVRSASR